MKILNGQRQQTKCLYFDFHAWSKNKKEEVKEVYFWKYTIANSHKWLHFFSTLWRQTYGGFLDYQYWKTL